MGTFANEEKPRASTPSESNQASSRNADSATMNETDSNRHIEVAMQKSTPRPRKPSPQQTAFAEHARWVERWLHSAEKLNLAAEAVWAEHEKLTAQLFPGLLANMPGGLLPEHFFASANVCDVYVLLAGLCLENVLKGLLIHADPQLVDDFGRLHKKISNHRLMQFAKHAGLESDLNADERQSLQLAQNAITYWGRYHIPPSHGELNSEHSWKAKYTDAVRTLYRRWAEKLVRAIYRPVNLKTDEYVRWRLDRLPPE